MSDDPRRNENAEMRTRVSGSAVGVLAALALSIAGCSTYQDDLARSQRAFEENQHETALAILRLLVLHAGKVLTHDQILKEIWNHGRNIDYLRVYMRQLRKRIEVDPHNPQYIVTLPGVGYQLLTED